LTIAFECQIKSRPWVVNTGSACTGAHTISSPEPLCRTVPPTSRIYSKSILQQVERGLIASQRQINGVTIYFQAEGLFFRMKARLAPTAIWLRIMPSVRRTSAPSFCAISFGFSQAVVFDAQDDSSSRDRPGTSTFFADVVSANRASSEHPAIVS